MLRDFEFKSSYNKLEDDVAQEFYMPCMQNSVIYNRISGYFGSTVYVVAWEVLKDFIKKDGKIRIVCSPYLSEDDMTAIEEGNKGRGDQILKESLQKELETMLNNQDLETPARLLTCLIAEGIIEIKIAIVKSDADPYILKLYHDKAGVFVDELGDKVAFRGSFNETYKGIANDGNIESADVFQSWDGGKDLERLEKIEECFEYIWEGKYEKIRMYQMPSEFKALVKKEASKYNIEELLDEIKVSENTDKKWTPNKKKKIIGLKKHQIRALDNWEKNGYRGIYQGCTGCGKTVISICAIRHELEQKKTVLVLVPAKELLYNWEKEIRRLLSDIDVKILLCGDGNTAWKKTDELRNWTSKSNSIYKIVIAMMDTASTNDFISRVNGGEHLFVVADEVHRTGSIKRRNLFNIKNGSTLGVSATPERYGDIEGTQALINYFGEVMKPPFLLEDAIKADVLTPYFYYPKSVELTEDEQKEWDSISSEIARMMAMNKDDEQSNSYIQKRSIDRARIIKKASNKYKKAVDIIKENYKPGQKWLVYCEDKKQLNTVYSMVDTLGFDVYKYYAEMEGDREATLDYFSKKGGIIVSIKCLDEGVDIPSTTHALIIASSKNPREFIQRRGRILRKANNKAFSTLYDVIAVPNPTTNNTDRSLHIVRDELMRAIEFGKTSENPACIADLKTIALAYGININKYIDEGEEDEK